jgi:intracellular septation protein
MLAILFEDKIEMSNEAWLILSRRWGFYFIFLAIVNEIIWRNFTTEFWVDFKVFGMMTFTIIFTVLQMPFMARQMKK